MPRYRYTAARRDGETYESVVDALDRADVARQVQSDGLIFIDATLEELPAAPVRRWRKRDLGAQDVEVLTVELATLLDAGLPLDGALGMMQRISRQPAAKQLLEKLQEQVRSGRPFSDALADNPALFSGLYIGLVKAGEASGQLGETLRRLALYLEGVRTLKDEILAAMLYPVILIVLSLGSVAVMVAFVVPRFAEMFADAGVDLPLSTQIVMVVGDFLVNYGLIVVGIVVVLLLVARHQFARESNRLQLDKWLLALPLVGAFIAKIEAARLSRTLGMLVDSGMPAPAALSLAAVALNNTHLSSVAKTIAQEVRSGERLAHALGAARVFPELMVHLLEVGEETGALRPMLERVAGIYESEVRRSIRRAVVLAEPILIVGIGLVVGGIIFSIVSAVLGINEVAL
jgi:general secretion pathway protein F